MNLPLTRKEIILISTIVVGIVGGGGIMAIAQGGERPFPDFGPEQEIEIAGETETENAEGDSKSAYRTSGTEKGSEPEEQKGPVNINTAGENELTRLNGIGPALAKRICDDRNANGPFKSIDDLQRVKGIGPATVEKNRDMIILGN